MWRVQDMGHANSAPNTFGSLRRSSLSMSLRRDAHAGSPTRHSFDMGRAESGNMGSSSRKGKQGGDHHAQC